MEQADTIGAILPERFNVSVVMARTPLVDNPWLDHRWEAIGVVAADSAAGPRVIERRGVREVVYSGFPLRLHRDECEAYYHNLRCEQPKCYVLCRGFEAGDPVPFLVSLSFDEANAYTETDDVEVFPVPVPPELYRWTEAFVLAHYVPEPRRKRKRQEWRESSRLKAIRKKPRTRRDSCNVGPGRNGTPRGSTRPRPPPSPKPCHRRSRMLTCRRWRTSTRNPISAVSCPRGSARICAALPCASCSIAPCATSGTDSMTTTTTSPASPN